MPVLYQRKIVVSVAGLEISEPRIHVSLDREQDRSQDSGAVKIFNLTPENAQRIVDRGEQITVQAGYPETVATIFAGRAQRIRRGRERLAHITTITLGDYVRSRQSLGGIFNRVYRGPIKVRLIAMDIIKDGLRLDHGPLDAIPESATFNNFYWAGPAEGALVALLNSVGCHYFEADGIVRVSCPGHVQTDAPTIRVSSKNGLIGTPRETDEGFEVELFCEPRAALGGVLDLSNDIGNGRHKIVALRHDLDNWAGKFKTNLTLRKIT